MRPGEYNNIPKLKKTIGVGVERALNASGEFITGEAQDRVAIDTGELHGLIGYDVHLDDQEVRIGTNVEHGIYVEFGTGIHAEGGDGRKEPWWYYYEGKNGPRGWRRTKGQKPQPWLRPALDDNKDRVPKLFKREIADELKKVIK